MKTKMLFLLGAALIQSIAANVSASSPDPGPPGDRVALTDVDGGMLLTRVNGSTGSYVPLPGLRTDIGVDIAGIAAHVEITQSFHNPSTRWLEATYVFPLPDNSAVTRLRMKVGDRIIEGVVKEKHQARRQYAQARDAGRKASLVEQQRPNLFTSSVANIPPGETINITLSYLETVSRDGDDYHLRIPLVAGPRYNPLPAGPAGNSEVADDPAPLRNPNTIPPALGKVNPVSLAFELDAGFELDGITSPYHRLETTRTGKTRVRGHLAGRAFADRDFELRWRPAAGTAPEVAAFVDRQGGESYVLLMLQPPLPDPGSPPASRELILIIDASGSMHGDSIEQALSAARFALSTLDSGDQFNIIRFSDTADMLFPSPQPADPAALAQAEQFLSRIDANGGTNMAAALERAFGNPVTRDLLRQIVFLTDGAVGNEAALFARIQAGTHSARLFTVGIGSAPNSYFMRRAARVGRGTHTFIGRTDEVTARMKSLFERLHRPALTDIHLDWHGAETDSGLSRVPDLYYDEPLTVTARVAGFNDLTVEGRYGGKPWRHDIASGVAAPAPWVSTLWARERIRQLKDELLGGGDRESVKKQITRIGLAHQLVTPYTSLVAVERRISRDPSDPLHHSDAPANLPHGWSYRHVFGSLPRTALAWRAELAAGLALFVLALSGWWFARRGRFSPASS